MTSNLDFLSSDSIYTNAILPKKTNEFSIFYAIIQQTYWNTYWFYFSWDNIQAGLQKENGVFGYRYMYSEKKQI